ncbi:MAG: hypothetical protein HY322_09860, partial [Betaproteobacteria bacterium]|nr:hypothetical protein [Betaproteobacteria bacterium]
MTTLHRLIIAAVLAAASPHLLAQVGALPAYPSKTIRMVVPYPPGAGTDLHARALAQKMTETLGQQVIVDNRSGANGIPAMELVAKSAPDGYTIVYALPAQYAVNPALYPRLPYDPVRDYDPIVLVVRTPLVLFAHPSVPARSIKELVRLAKAKADNLTSAKRTAALPDLPAIAETLPGYDISNWYGAAGPKGMPRAVIARLNTEIQRALNTLELRQGFEREAIEP